jgi:hypothetical protein
MNIKRTFLIAFVILSEGSLLTWGVKDQNLRMYFSIIFLLLHVMIEIYITYLTSKFIRLWIYGTIGHLIMRDILPFFFMTGNSSLFSCVLIWSVLIFGRLLIHYLHLDHVFIAVFSGKESHDPILDFFPSLMKYQVNITKKEDPYFIEDETRLSDDDNDDFSIKKPKPNSFETLETLDPYSSSSFSNGKQQMTFDDFYPVSLTSGTNLRNRTPITNGSQSSHSSSSQKFQNNNGGSGSSSNTGGLLENILWISHRSQYRFTLLFLISLQLGLHFSSITTSNTIPLHRGLGVLSLLNLIGNAMYSLLIYYFLQNTYLTLLCYLLFWLNIWDFIGSFVITYLILILTVGTLRYQLDDNNNTKDRTTTIKSTPSFVVQDIENSTFSSDYVDYNGK